MSNKVIVFGGSGFLGSHIADSLTENGYEVTIFDKSASAYLRESQKMLIGDILDAQAVRKAVRGMDVVYNFAGLADLDSSTIKPVETLRENVEGALNILEACRESGAKRFVFASTIYVYSDKGGFYRCSKQSSETYIEEFHKQFGINYTILRYGTVYGPRADERNSIYRYIAQALKERRIKVSGDGEEMREYIHVHDAAQLSVQILGPEYANRCFIITGHHPLKLKDLLATIGEMMNTSLAIEYQPGTNPHHYSMTPYSFSPKLGKKLTTNCYTDIGQGLLDCFNEISRGTGARNS